MWRDLEEDAIKIGLDLHYFWSLNPKQFEKHVKVFNDKEKERIKEVDIFNYSLAKYIGQAVNYPENYPKQPFSMQETVEYKEMTVDEMEKQARLNTVKLGGVINGT